MSDGGGAPPQVDLASGDMEAPAVPSMNAIVADYISRALSPIQAAWKVWHLPWRRCETSLSLGADAMVQKAQSRTLGGCLIGEANRIKSEVVCMWRAYHEQHH